MSLCGGGFDPPNPDEPCCYGSAFGGACTCWTETTDIPYVPRAECVEGPNPLQPAKCHDCAYRPGSQERDGGSVYDAELPTGRDRPFYCHQGMPRTTGYDHPSGARIEVEADSYSPVMDNARAWTADGSPAPLCAGWAEVSGVRKAARAG